MKRRGNFFDGHIFSVLSFKGILSHFGLSIFCKELLNEAFFGNLNNVGAYLIKFPLPLTLSVSLSCVLSPRRSIYLLSQLPESSNSIIANHSPETCTCRKRTHHWKHDPRWSRVWPTHCHKLRKPYCLIQIQILVLSSKFSDVLKPLTFFFSELFTITPNLHHLVSILELGSRQTLNCIIMVNIAKTGVLQHYFEARDWCSTKTLQSLICCWLH